MADFGVFTWPPSEGSGSGVTTLNGLTGDLFLAAGSGISITPSGGNTLTIASTSAGDVTLGAFGSTPNANGLSIGSQVLNMQPADGTHPGGVSILAQTFAGNKTFSGTISASNLSGTNTGDVTLTAVGAAPSANGATLSGQALTLQPADSTHPGVLTAADWNTFNGKQSALTIGNLTAAGTDGIAVSNGTGAVIGSGTSLAQHVADTTHNGYLSSTDWNTFNGKQSTALTSAHIWVGNVSNVAADVAMSGDIAITNAGVTSYSGTVPLNKGGTGQTTKAAAFDALSPMSAGGDLIYGGASGTGTRLANGSADQVLTSTGGTSAPIWNAAPGLNSSSALVNLGLSVTTSSNTLIVALKQADGTTDPASGSGAVKLGIRNTTATSGAFSSVSVTAAASMTLAATDSLGVVASSAQILYVYWINDTTSEIGLSATLFDESVLTSASALTGGADTDATKLWSTNAHTSRPIRLIGRLVATWSNPNWGSITDVAVKPFSGGLMTFTVTSGAGAAASGSTGGTAGSNGTGTWICPKGVFNVWVTGRGGGGGGAGGGNTTQGSGGAGGGAASVTVSLAVVPGTSYTLTAGAGGAGSNGVNGTTSNGSTGTDTTFGSLLTFRGAVGGVGAGSADLNSILAGGAGVGGGGKGAYGHTTVITARAGSPGTFGAGGSPGTTGGGGAGGGDGAGGNGGNTGANIGTIGTTGGGGGGGGENSGAGAGGGGGAGGTGQITVSWYQN